MKHLFVPPIKVADDVNINTCDYGDIDIDSTGVGTAATRLRIV
jgi:hypothetical protein